MSGRLSRTGTREMTGTTGTTRTHGTAGTGRPKVVSVVSGVAGVAEVSSTAIPRLRFKGFEGEWKKRKIEACFEERDERSGEGELLSVTMGAGVIRAAENGKLDNSSADKSHYKCVRIGDVAYNSMRMWQGACGASRFKGIVSPAYTVITPREGYTAPFFQRLFKLPSTLKVFQERSQGMTSDTWNLKFPLLKEIEVLIPELREQSRIADFFSRLDAAIAAAKARVGKLRRVKKAMLVKMFPRECATVPEIRFKGFEGEWEKDSAANIFETTNERNHPELRVVSANQERGMIYRDEGGMQIAHNKENEKTYKRVCPGNFVIHLRSFQGGFAHSVIEGITSPAYTVMRFREGAAHNDYFWRYILTSKQFIKRLEVITYGIRDGRSISFEEFATMQMAFPHVAEQRKIGAFFSNLDRLIAAAEKRVGKLKQVKASLLEGMFA